MKRFLIIGIIFFGLFSLFSCTQTRVENEDEDYTIHISLPPVTLDFSSLDDFLDAHRAVREGTADEELMDLAQQTDFAELEEIFFPTAIPEAYQLYSIRVHRHWVSMRFLHEEYLISEKMIQYAHALNRFFSFGMQRMDTDYPMEGIMQQFNVTEADLIDGIFLFEPPNLPNRLTWGTERTHMHLQFPWNYIIDENFNPIEMISLLDVDNICLETGERVTYTPSPPRLPQLSPPARLRLRSRSRMARE